MAFESGRSGRKGPAVDGLSPRPFTPRVGRAALGLTVAMVVIKLALGGAIAAAVVRWCKTNEAREAPLAAEPLSPQARP